MYPKIMVNRTNMEISKLIRSMSRIFWGALSWICYEARVRRFGWTNEVCFGVLNATQIIIQKIHYHVNNSHCPSKDPRLPLPCKTMDVPSWHRALPSRQSIWVPPTVNTKGLLTLPIRRWEQACGISAFVNSKAPLIAIDEIETYLTHAKEKSVLTSTPKASKIVFGFAGNLEDGYRLILFQCKLSTNAWCRYNTGTFYGKVTFPIKTLMNTGCRCAHSPSRNRNHRLKY